jgi:hypothetical protein
MSVFVGKRKINPTTSQHNRWLRALDPGYAKVDDRSFNQLLDFSVQFGSLINFFNLDDEVDGDWEDFFQTDPSMVFASIESIKIASVEKYFDQLQRQADIPSTQGELEAPRDAIELITRLASRFDAWMVALNNNPREPAASVILRDNLQSLIESNLSEHLQQLQLLFYQHKAKSKEQLKQHAKQTEASQQQNQQKISRREEIEFPGFSRIWKLNRTLSTSSDLESFTGREAGNIFDSLLVILNAFIDGLADLQDYVRYNLPEPDGSARHRPQVALYMAFARLYRHAQETVNTFSSRYARFYYQDILREHQRRATADHVYLNFTLEQGEEIINASVPAATFFSAGQDANGGDIIYAADKSLLVSAAALAQLRMLNVISGPLLVNNEKNNTADNPLVVHCVLASEIALDENGQGRGPWLTFGGQPDAEPATLGFAISSPYLLLSGGERYVELQFQYTREYYQNILRPLLVTLGEATGRNESDIFYQVLRGAFGLYASSVSEWFEIEDYSIAFHGNSEKQAIDQVNEDIFLDRIFRICFTLPASAPALEPYDSERGGSGGFHSISSDEPMINIYLSQQAISLKAIDGASVEVHPISLLGKMTLNAANVFTRVRNLNNMTLQNTDGEIDPSSPFLVFGGNPVVGSYFQLSHRELFVKTPNYLAVTVEWFNIPQNDTGFSGYYRYYDIGPNGRKEPGLFNNTTFLGAIKVVNPGGWDIGNSQAEPPEHSESVYLFRTQAAPDGSCCLSPPVDDKPLCSYTNFDKLDVSSPLLDNQGSNKLPRYYNPADSALRLTLSAPSYAFGNSLYPQNVLNAVIEDLPDTDECREKCLCDCRPIEDTIICLQSILESCLAIADPNKRLQCIKVRLAEGEITLITAFIQCLLRCLTDYESVDDDQALKKIKDTCNELLQQLPAMRLQNIKKCLDAVIALDKTTDKKSGKNCPGDCEAIYQVAVILYKTMQCVEQCSGTEDGAACERACLLSSLEQVQAIYETQLTACMDTCMIPAQELKYPNEPYLPQAVSVRVDYQAACTLFDVVDENSIEPNSAFYHLLPFEGYRQLNCSCATPLPMLPSYVNNGNLYIGMSALTTPQLLTLLFQLNGVSGLELPRVQWDVLSDNQWRALPPVDDIADSTHGLQNTGIVSLDIPATNNIGNTLLDNQYTWLRAGVLDRAQEFPLTQAIFPHALPASRVIDEPMTGGKEIKDSPAKEKPDVVLPAHSINSAIEELPYLSQINQPMPSFGGRTPETYPEFEVRMGERVRHKDRAIQAWDYERLVLEKFPDVWKVQALSAHGALHGNAPGHVLVVVIAGPNGIDCSDPTMPTLPNERLQRIQQELQERASPFVTLHVCNPVYVRVQVNVSVSFYNEENPGANIERLNSDLVQYLSPWFYPQARPARDGDYASEADIASFILNRTYVRTMGSISYSYEPKPETLNADWYFLTSAIQHTISVSNHQTCPIAESGCSY